MEVRGDLTLDRIHTCLQVAMGWTDSHLHRFGGQGVKPWQAPWFATAYDEEDEDTGTAESAARIDQVLRTPGDWLTYIYDFCDGWVHRVEIEGVRPATAADAPARCPPEDVGGIPTWNEIAAALRADPDPHGTARLAAAAHRASGQPASDEQWSALLRRWQSIVEVADPDGIPLTAAGWIAPPAYCERLAPSAMGAHRTSAAYADPAALALARRAIWPDSL